MRDTVRSRDIIEPFQNAERSIPISSTTASRSIHGVLVRVHRDSHDRGLIKMLLALSNLDYLVARLRNMEKREMSRCDKSLARVVSNFMNRAIGQVGKVENIFELAALLDNELFLSKRNRELLSSYHINNNIVRKVKPGEESILTDLRACLGERIYFVPEQFIDNQAHFRKRQEALIDSGIKTVVEPFLRELEKIENINDERKIAYRALLQRVSNSPLGGWEVAPNQWGVGKIIEKINFLLKMVDDAEKTSDKAALQRRDLLLENVDVFEDLVWELICKSEYFSVKLRVLIQQLTRKRFRKALSIVEKLLAELEQYRYPEEDEVIANWLVINREYLRKAQDNLKAYMRREGEHFSYRAILLENAFLVPENLANFPQLLRLYDNYLEGLGLKTVEEKTQYMKRGIELQFTGLADFIIRQTEFETMFRMRTSIKNPVILVMDRF